jgi:hypothetical protein
VATTNAQVNGFAGIEVPIWSLARNKEGIEVSPKHLAELFQVL